jgi:soluble lytic murein transglycosylase
LAAYDALSPQEQQDERWRYWQARALEATGRLDQARPIYEALARQRSYFGFLAADRIQQPYMFTHQHLQVSTDAMQAVRVKPAFQRIYELLQLDRYGDVRREWLAIFPNLSSQERLAAVQLAANWGLHQFAIAGLAELGQMDDLDLRFPVAFDEQVQRYAARRQLDPALVLAIMRRESAFDPAAQSPAGARGLMQLMPETGRIIAARLGEPGLQTERLKEPERNIAYGTAYLAKLLDDFNNRLIFAVAAYNAGPIKVQAWLQNTLTPVPGDVWVETLPYHETREYVAAVLSYLAIYQQRLGRTPTPLSNFLGPVSGSALPPLVAGQADAF